MPVAGPGVLCSLSFRLQIRWCHTTLFPIILHTDRCYSFTKMLFTCSFVLVLSSFLLCFWGPLPFGRSHDACRQAFSFSEIKKKEKKKKERKKERKGRMEERKVEMKKEENGFQNLWPTCPWFPVVRTGIREAPSVSRSPRSGLALLYFQWRPINSVNTNHHSDPIIWTHKGTPPPARPSLHYPSMFRC